MDIAALNSTLALRSRVLKWMCLCLGVLSGIFAVFNLLINDFLILGALEVVFSVYCFGIYFYITKHVFKLWQPVSICTFVSLLVVLGSYLSSVYNALFVWTLVLPVLYYLLLGKLWGFGLSMSLALLQAIGLITKESVVPYSPSNLGLNLAFSYITIWAIAHVFETSRASFSKRLEDLAMLDPLTGAGNRLAMNQYFEIELSDKENLYTMVMDLDFFKKVNDEFGHAIGDNVLIEVTKIIKSQLTKEGAVFRIGGEEFAIFVAHSSASEAANIAENIRHTIENNKLIIAEQSVSITASIGVIAYSGNETLKQTIKAADDRLYQAKNNGRNQVVFNDPPQRKQLNQAS